MEPADLRAAPAAGPTPAPAARATSCAPRQTPIVGTPWESAFGDEGDLAAEPGVLSILVGLHRPAEDHDGAPERRFAPGAAPPSATTQRSSRCRRARRRPSRRARPRRCGPGSWTTESTRTGGDPTVGQKRRSSVGGGSTPPAAGIPRLVEEPAEDLRAPRREVVPVVVEERVDLLRLAGESGDRLARPTPRTPPGA